MAYIVILNSGYGKTFLAKKYKIFNDFSGHFFESAVSNGKEVFFRDLLDYKNKINLINPPKKYEEKILKNKIVIVPSFNDNDKRKIAKNFLLRELKRLYFNDFIYKKEKKEKIREQLIKKYYTFNVLSLETFAQELIDYINNNFGEDFKLL